MSQPRRKGNLKHSPALGQILRGARRDQGRQQGELAKHLGICQGELSRKETGESSISFDQFCEAAAFLGVSIVVLAHRYQCEVIS